MFNDIVRENILKDRLEELKMLSLSDAGVHVSGGKLDNKEGWFGFGGKKTENKKIPPLQVGTHEKLIDLTKYIVLHVWRFYNPGAPGSHIHNLYELRYYRGDNRIHYFINGIEYEAHECEDQYYQTGLDRYNQILEKYEVMDQKTNFYSVESIVEIRRYYKNDTRHLWEFENNTWSDITQV